MLTALPSWLIASPVQRAVKSRLRESERYAVISAPYIAQHVVAQ